MIHRKDYTFVMSQLLPEGRRGRFAIEKKVIQKGTIMRTYSPAGFFYFDKFSTNFPMVTLAEKGDLGETIWMSDTPMEQEGLRIPTIIARGNVLVLGLGIGLFPTLLKMYNKLVKKVTIIEKEPEVVQLVYPHIKSTRTEVLVCGGEQFLQACKDKFDFIYVDVWGSTTAPLREADRWTELASRCLAEGGEVKCWLQELYDRIKTRLPTAKTGPPAIYDPCLTCGKRLRYDYAGLCMDCADMLELSEYFVKE